MATTANYGWTKPTVGGDSGAWGTILNNLFDAVDSALKTVENLANAALPKAGGTMTGTLNTKVTAAARLSMGNIAGSTNFDLAAQQTYTATLAGNATFQIINVPGGNVTSGFTLQLTNGGAFAITWPGNMQWHAGTPPTLSAAGKDLLVFISHDAGASWLGVVVAQGIA